MFKNLEHPTWAQQYVAFISTKLGKQLKCMNNSLTEAPTLSLHKKTFKHDYSSPVKC